MQRKAIMLIMILALFTTAACDPLAPENIPPEKIDVEVVKLTELEANDTHTKEPNTKQPEEPLQVPSLENLPIVGNTTLEEREQLRNWTVYFLASFKQDPIDYERMYLWEMENEDDKQYASIITDEDGFEIVKALFDLDGTLLLLYTNGHYIYKSM